MLCAVSLLSVLNVSAETREIFNVGDLYTTYAGQGSSENGAGNAEVAVVVIDEDGNRREILFSDPQVEDTRNLSWAEFERLYPLIEMLKRLFIPFQSFQLLLMGSATIQKISASLMDKFFVLLRMNEQKEKGCFTRSPTVKGWRTT